MDEEEWKTAYDVQIYVTSLSAISDCNWNKLELWVNFHQDGFIYKLRHYYPVLSAVSYTHLTLPTKLEV